MSEVIFVSGIDTDAGKTFATGFLARKWMDQGKKVATLKFIQTGCNDFSEDIEKHRQIMGVELPEDKDHTTAPIIFTYPASPHLAARIDKKIINLSSVDKAIEKLSENYDIILVEGAGGLMVPVSEDFMTIDYPLTRQYPVILVTNGILGSINHTILSLEAIRNRDMDLYAVAYNRHFDQDKIISDDARNFIQRYVERHYPETKWIEIPSMV